MCNWIPCSERLPEPNNRRLSTNVSIDVLVPSSVLPVTLGRYNYSYDDWEVLTPDGWVDHCAVSHWQPLPERPGT